MLFSLALVFIIGLTAGQLFKTIKLPSLLGYMLTGIVLGPHALNVINGSLLDISADLRQIALIIILTRAGLNLNISELKKVGRSAVMMCFVPAGCEIIGMILLAPIFFDISRLDAAILGSVIAAVSPAVVVPRMLKLMENGYGRSKSIPQMIMAGASVDDVFVIVLFSSFTALASGKNFSYVSYLRIPTSIILGILGGIAVGLILRLIFSRFKMNSITKILITLSTSFILVTIDGKIKGNIGFSGLLAIMTFGIVLKMKCADTSEKLSADYSKLWQGAEILLFSLVGMTVNISYATDYGFKAVGLIFLVLIFRMLGVFLSVLGTKLNSKERLFCMLAYCPKATVQAAIGAIPLSMGLSCGDLVLTAAVLAILITAPLGAFAVDMTYKRLLVQ